MRYVRSKGNGTERMQIFGWCYNRVVSLGNQPNAPWYLGILSFFEAIIFPIPVEALLVPMVLSRPQRALVYGLLAAMASALGGIVGYLLGFWAFEPIVSPAIDWLGYNEAFKTVSIWFQRWGFWAVLMAGVSPLPFKIFTVGAGVFQMSFMGFVFAALVSRALWFTLVSKLVVLGGAKVDTFIQRYIERIGWLTVGLLAMYVVF